MPTRVSSPLSQSRLPRTPSHLYPNPSASPPLSSPSPLTAPIPSFEPPRRQPLSRESSARESPKGLHGDVETDEEEAGEDCHAQHPLQAEIERLSALCDQHELKYRSSKVSFEHRVFSEFPSILARLTELDSQAEKATAELYTSMNQAVPKLQARLAALLEERSADVETMRQRTTPWTDFVDEKSDMSLKRVKSGQRVGRISRIRQDAGSAGAEADALAMIERWADEVEMSLTADIARLKAQLGEENRKRIIVFRLVVVAAGVVAVIVALLVLRKRAFSMFV